MSEIYDNCHILLKSSKVESFSYPPLEMMATGGICIVVGNEGNSQYLNDRVNSLFYKLGDLDNARKMIYQICQDEDLRNYLIQNGLRTASERNWDNYETRIIKAYDDL